MRSVPLSLTFTRGSLERLLSLLSQPRRIRAEDTNSPRFFSGRQLTEGRASQHQQTFARQIRTNSAFYRETAAGVPQTFAAKVCWLPLYLLGKRENPEEGVRQPGRVDNGIGAAVACGQASKIVPV